MKSIKIELLEDIETEYYNVFEDLKELNDITLDLFERKDFAIEDIEDLSKLKLNIINLNNMIDKKVTCIYQELINKDL